jgi:hypothetical protein
VTTMSTIYYYCPYCTQIFSNQIGYDTLQKHVEREHPKRLHDFKKITKEKLMVEHQFDINEQPIIKYGSTHCPISSKDCDRKDCRMSIQFFSKDKSKSSSMNFCAFCEFFIKDTEHHLRSKYFPDFFKTETSIALQQDDVHTEKEFNKSDEEIKKELTALLKDKYNLDSYNIRYQDYEISRNVTKEYCEINSLDGHFLYGNNIDLKIERIANNIIQEYHFEDVKNQKEKIPGYIDGFIAFADEHGIKKYQKKHFDSFLIIKGIKIYSELLPAVLTLTEAKFSRKIKDSAGVNEYVYFVSNKKTNEIKIGYSKNPEGRVPQLQTSTPGKLELLKKIPGDLDTERGIHEMFADIRIIHGENTSDDNEWFEATDELKKFIENVK